jgi:hypothetical protein
MKCKSRRQKSNPTLNKREGRTITNFRGKRNALQIEADKEFAKTLFLKGHTSREIMVELNKVRDYTLSHVTICEDIKEIKSEMEANLSLEVKGHISRALAKIDLQEKELWAAWERSKGTHTKTITTRTGKKKSTTVNQVAVQNRDGNRQFQAELTKLDSQRRAILGLDQPKRQILQDEKGAPLEFVIRLSETELP